MEGGVGGASGERGKRGGRDGRSGEAGDARRLVEREKGACAILASDLVAAGEEGDGSRSVHADDAFRDLRRGGRGWR